MNARVRYVAKPRGKKWGVYDRETASWPGQRPEFGPVKQDVATEAEALAEADRLEAKETKR